MIVKVQLPVYSSEDDAPALVYNEDKSVMLMIEVTDEVLAATDGPKGFFEAEIDEDGLLHLGEQVADQGW